MIEWAHDKIAELIDLVRAGAVLGAVAIVLYAYLKTRTLIAVLVAALTAGIFLWAINNTDWWQRRVGEESGAVAPVVVTEAGAGEDWSAMVDTKGWRW